MNITDVNTRIKALSDTKQKDIYSLMGELERFRLVISTLMDELWIEYDYPYPLNLRISTEEFYKKYPESFYVYKTCENTNDVTESLIYINEESGIAILANPNYAGFCIRTPECEPALLKFIAENFSKESISHTPKVGLLSYSNARYSIEYKDINSIVELDWDTNYNEDFKTVHENLYENITTLSKSLHILHGSPGTGKTTYLRYLISLLSKGENKVVYLPSNLTYILSNPDFISNVGILKNKILIIEDAEEILIAGDKRSLAISNILNISDGILGDIYQLHMIFTFNTAITQIDPAILRKGRLNFKYEFAELEESKARALCEKLNVEYKGYKTLAEIYNSVENGAVIKKTKNIGFLAA